MMKTWNVTMLYYTSAHVEVEASGYDEAVERAKELVDEFKSDYLDIDDLEFEEVTYASRLGER